MAEFPGGRPADGLAASGRVVKLADLDAILPEGTPTWSPTQREEQLTTRRAAYDRRLPEAAP
jgi:hypothetical protein